MIRYKDSKHHDDLRCQLPLIIIGPKTPSASYLNVLSERSYLLEGDGKNTCAQRVTRLRLLGGSESRVSFLNLQHSGSALFSLGVRGVGSSNLPVPTNQQDTSEILKFAGLLTPCLE